MLHRKLLTAAVGLFLAAGALMATPDAAFACHEATGWCCVNHTCCYFENNVLRGCVTIE